LSVQYILVTDAANVVQNVACTPALGQSNMAGCLPVAIANDQSQINVGSHILSGLATGANTIGAVDQAGTWQVLNWSSVEIVPTVTAGAYSSGQTIGGIIIFNNILPVTLGATLKTLQLKFKGSVQTGEFDVALFTTSPTGTFTDNHLPAIAAGDTAYLLGVYRLLNAQSILGTHTIYTLNGIEQEIEGTTTSLYAVVVAKTAPTNPASITDMSLRLNTYW